MEVIVSKVISPVLSIIKLVWKFFIDKTNINIFGQEILYSDKETLYVSDQGKNSGLFLFVVATKSKKPVDVVRIEIEFAAPLQLLDPEKRGFFSIETSFNRTYPFRVFSDTSFTIQNNIRYVFALNAIYPKIAREQNVMFCIHAQRRHFSFGGYLDFGRTQVTRIRKKIQLTSEFVTGFDCPPKSGIRIIQPFLVERAATVAGKEISFTVHESFKDGSVATSHITGD